VWSYDDQPMTHLDHDAWLELFRAAAPITQPTNLPALSFPLTLYRGSTHQRRRRMSWTAECQMARQFIKRHREYGDAALYSVVVERDAVLAHLNLRRVEFEVVVDPAMLDEPERLRSDTARCAPAEHTFGLGGHPWRSFSGLFRYPLLREAAAWSTLHQSGKVRGDAMVGLTVLGEDRVRLGGGPV
jgi:hypothetical protein